MSKQVQTNGKRKFLWYEKLENPRVQNYETLLCKEMK